MAHRFPHVLAEEGYQYRSGNQNQSGTNEKNAQKNREKRSGFSGIGIRFRISKMGVLVTQVFTKSPAHKAGIKSGDIITHVNENWLKNIKYIDAQQYFRGKIGSIVDLKLLRPSTKSPEKQAFLSYNLSIKRNRIITPTTSYSLRNNILYIEVTSFNSKTSKNLAKDIKDGLKSAYVDSAENVRGIILDLRGNPGGLLKQAIKVSNLFLFDGKIITTKGRHPSSTNDYLADGSDLTKGLPIVVLINGRSASAAEIVAAALQDHARAVIVGSSSFGKGTVQNIIQLPNAGELAITWSRFQTPSGYYLHSIGVLPSICVTSSKKSNAMEYIYGALNKATQIIRARRAWHASSISDKLGRERLKKICPTTNKKNSVDIQIADRLLHNDLLYHKFIALNTSIQLPNN